MIAKGLAPENGAKVFAIMVGALGFGADVTGGTAAAVVNEPKRHAHPEPGQQKRRAPAWGPPLLGRQGQAGVSASSAVRLRVWLGSTGMPGPIEVVKVTFLRYRPRAAAGLSLITSSSAAA